jgi:hypothetical protein
VRRLLLSFAVTKKRKTYLFSLAAMALAANAQAIPLTHFLPNAAGGFEAFIYPELLDGTPSVVGGIFALPQTVNAGYVIILENAASNPRDIANWSDVITFIDNGNGKATSIQMLDGGPNQATYFPSLSMVSHSPSAFVIESQNGNGFTDFTGFTDYSVKSKQTTRNYHFFTGDAFSVTDSGSTLMLLGVAFVALAISRRRLLQA